MYLISPTCSIIINTIILHTNVLIIGKKQMKTTYTENTNDIISSVFYNNYCLFSVHKMFIVFHYNE